MFSFVPTHSRFAKHWSLYHRNIELHGTIILICTRKLVILCEKNSWYDLYLQNRKRDQKWRALKMKGNLEKGWQVPTKLVLGRYLLFINFITYLIFLLSILLTEMPG